MNNRVTKRPHEQVAGAVGACRNGSRSLTTLIKIQIALTALVFAAFLVGMLMAGWLHSMAYDDPVRQAWEPKLDRIGDILWFCTIVPWLVFTVYHVVVRVGRKL